MAQFRITRRENEFRFFGDLNEFSDFAVPLEEKGNSIFVELVGIQNINSSGVRSWVDFINEFNGRLTFRTVPIHFMEYFNDIPSMIGENSWIETFFAPFYCEECDWEKQSVLHINDINRESRLINQPVVCPHCSMDMTPDFDEEEYFLFCDYIYEADHREDKENKESEQETKESAPKIENEEEREFSQSPRKPLKAKVSMSDLECEGTPYTMFSENISRNGLFLTTYLKFELGTNFRIEFMLPLKSAFHNIVTEVEVRWIRKEDPEKHILPGIGVKFLCLEEGAGEKVQTYIDSFYG